MSYGGGKSSNFGTPNDCLKNLYLVAFNFTHGIDCSK